MVKRAKTKKLTVKRRVLRPARAPWRVGEEIVQARGRAASVLEAHVVDALTQARHHAVHATQENVNT